MTNPPSYSSSTLAEVEVEEHEAILEDLSDGDTDSDDPKKRENIYHCDDDDEEEQQETKVSEYHAKNYFNSTMGGKDL